MKENVQLPSITEFVEAQKIDSLSGQLTAIVGELGTQFDTDENSILVRRVTIHRSLQKIVLASLCQAVLINAHKSVTAGQPACRRMSDIMRREYYQPLMGNNVYPRLDARVSCRRTRQTFNHERHLQPFPTSTLLEFVAMHFLGHLLKTYRGTRFVIVIRVGTSKRMRAILRKVSMAPGMAMIFIEAGSWRIAYLSFSWPGLAHRFSVSL